MNETGPPPDPDFEHATDVSDYLMEVLRKAYMDRDFGTFQHRAVFPQTIGTFNGEETLNSVADLRIIFDKVCAVFDKNGIIDMNRRTLEATFLAPDHVQATVASRYLLPNLSLWEEVIAQCSIKHVDGLWRIAESRYATSLPDVTRALSIKD